MGLSPIIIATIIAVGLMVIGVIVVPGPDKPLHRLLVITAVICLYLMYYFLIPFGLCVHIYRWLSCYVSQMTPLAPPQPKAAE